MANTKPKSRWKLVVTLLVLLAAGGGAGYHYYGKREKPVTVQTEKVTRRNLTEVVVANGRIQPVLMVKISPEVSGEIIELPVKEGQKVKKGDLLTRIKPDFYDASRKSSQANYEASLAGKRTAAANLAKAVAELKRNEELSNTKLISESAYLEVQTTLEIAKAQLDSAAHQVEMAKAALDKAIEDLSKTVIRSPLDGTIARLNSQPGERVVGTAMMAGTEIMTVADLTEMEARVDIGEIDVVLIAVGQKARLEVEAFRDRKFNGIVTEIANSSKGSAGLSTGGGGGGGGASQEATKFEVRIRVQEKEIFRPGMTVTAEVETRYRTNVLSVPIQSVTTRLPKKPGGDKGDKQAEVKPDTKPADTNPNAPKKKDDAPKAIEVVFLKDGDKAKMAKVKPGISDEDFLEIIEGLTEGQEVVSGGYKAISRELEDGKLIKIGPPKGSGSGEKKP